MRTGLEDNVRYDKTRLAESNAELVSLAAGLCADYGRHVASPAEAATFRVSPRHSGRTRVAAARRQFLSLVRGRRLPPQPSLPPDTAGWTC